MRNDLRFALRRLRRHRAHSLLVILTLALGIGASLAVVSIVDAVLLRPLPYANPDRLVALSRAIPALNLPNLSFSNIAYRRIRDDVPSLRAVAAYTQRDVNLLHGGVARRLVVAQVTASVFDVLQVAPALGRQFTREEDARGAGKFLVLSDALWRTAFNADPSIIGSTADLEGEPFTIVGVLPRDVAFPSRDVAAWEPLQLDESAVEPYSTSYTLVGRLKDGARIDVAQREATSIVQAVGREFPGPHPGSALDPSGHRAEIRPLGIQVVGDVRPVVLLLLAGVSMLLLLTCANVANLQLASAIQRSQELSLHAAFGATRARIVRSAAIGGLVLSTCGVAIGVLIAVGAARLFETLVPLAVTTSRPVIGLPMIVTALVLVVALAAAVGILPVIAITGRDPSSGLRERSSGSTPRIAATTRRVLAAAQFALAVTLVHSAGLLIASARQVQRQSPGFVAASTVTTRINIPAPTFRDRTQRELLLRRLLDEVKAIPGVQAVGIANALPLTPGRQDLGMAVEGRPFKADGTDPLADYRVTTAGYFAAMGIPVLQGRVFTDDDATQTYTPIVISASLAKLLFPDGADPIGRRLKFGPVSPWMPIIGVVADAKNRSLTDTPRPELYTPGLGTWSNLAFRTEVTIVVRARGDAMSLAQPLQRVVASVAPDVATYDLTSLDGIVQQAGARMATTTKLMTAYAIAAFLLAVAGVYAMLSYLVTQRMQELAVRSALGAPAAAILRLVAMESARVVGTGAVLGMLGAFLSARLLSGLLFGIGSLDPVVTTAVIVVAGVGAVASGIVPAMRAIRVDPNVALRSRG